MKKKFGLKDFVQSVDQVMQTQEKENPAIKQVHARLSPEWKTVSAKIAKLLNLQEEKEIADLREEIVASGEIATRVLLDFLLTLIQKTSSPKE